MRNNGLHEILTTRLWNMRRESLNVFRSAIEGNAAMHVAFKEEDKIQHFFASRSNGFSNALVTSDDPEWDAKYGRIKPDDEFIDVICVHGPITRGGGACSYGSKEMRDQMMFAADQENCLGHIVMLDTPGGSAWSKHDFRQAIDYVHSKGQKIIAFVDGMCCSAGMCLASMCDRIIYMNPADEIGCIGTMAAFYATPDGAVNTIDGERYIEVYADQSPDKNREFRDAAEGNYEKLRAEITADAAEFLQIVRAGRPNVTDEYLSGKVYPASEVEGILVDAQGTFDDAVKYILSDYDLYGGTKPYPRHDAAPASDSSASNSALTSDSSAGSSVPDSPDSALPSDSSEDLNNQKQVNMGKNYSKIQSALNLEALESANDNSLWLTEEMADTIETALDTAEKTKEALDAKVRENKTLNEAVAQAKSECAAEIETLKAENAKALEDAQAENAKALEDAKAENEKSVETLKAENAKALEDAKAENAAAVEALQKEIDELKQKNGELTSTLAEKDAEIAELAGNSSAAPKPAASDSSEEEKEVPADSVQKIYSPEMTRAQKREALKKRMNSLRFA